MIWNSPAEFFAMGGYALYVWGSCAACALLMVAEPVLVRARSKAIVQRLRNESRAEREFDDRDTK